MGGKEVGFRVVPVTKNRDYATGRIESAQAVQASFEVEEKVDEYTPAPNTMLEQELFGN